jgi:hypothetical protein
MGILATIEAIEIAKQIKTDGVTARTLISQLGSHYAQSKNRFVELLAIDESDAYDRGAVIAALTGYIEAIDELRAVVSADRDTLLAGLALPPSSPPLTPP